MLPEQIFNYAQNNFSAPNVGIFDACNGNRESRKRVTMPKTTRQILRFETLKERAVPASWGSNSFFEHATQGVGLYGITGVHEPGGPDLLPPQTKPPVVLPSVIALEGVGGEPAYHSSDVLTGTGNDCVFASTIAAEVLSGGQVGIRYNSSANQYQAKLYNERLIASWIDVPFDGTVYEDDLQPADSNELWAMMMNRANDALAYGNFLLTSAMARLTGVQPSEFNPYPTSRLQAEMIRNALTQGRAVTAGTIDASSHPTITLNSQYGIVRDHAYTVMGIELPATGTDGTWITLRNPWGRDNHWTAYDLDRSGALNLAEWFDYKSGIDGTNDGIIRVPWNLFGDYFDQVVISGKATGVSANKPQQQNRMPVFTNPYPGPFTIREGERIDINLPATDPEDRAVFYSVDSGPGYIQVQSGAYTWLPTSNDLGRFSVTVKAQTTFDSDCNTVTFIIDVTSGRPRIQSLSASTNTVTDAGSDPLVLTANGVIHDFDDVDYVEFFRDANGNGTLEPESDVRLKSDGNISDGWSWSGQLTGVTPGNYQVFARAARYSFSDLFFSNVVSTNIQVTAAPPPVEVAFKVGGETTIATNSTPNVWFSALKTTKDSAGNTYCFYNTTAGITMQRYNAEMAAIGGPTLIVSTQATDVAMMPNGQFVVVWGENNYVYARRHNPDGSTASGVITVSTQGELQYEDDPRSPRIAVDANGGFSVVWFEGASYYGEHSYFRRFDASNNPITSILEFRTGFSRDGAPGLTIDRDGNAIVVWSSSNTQRIHGHVITPQGRMGGRFDVSSVGDETNGAISVVPAPDGGFVVAWGSDHAKYRRFNASRQPVDATPKRLSAVNGSGTPKLVTTASGYIVAVWGHTARDPGDGEYDNGVYGQVIDPQGRLVGDNFRVPTTLTSSQNLGGIGADAGLDFTVTWSQLDPNLGAYGTHSSIRYQRYTIDLPPMPVTTPVQSVGRNAKRTVSIPAVDLDGQAVSVTHVNGVAIASGAFVDLPSGGRLTRNANGTLSYEPRGNVTVGVIDSVAITVSDGTKSSAATLSFRIEADLSATVQSTTIGRPEIRLTELPANRATALQVTATGIGADGLLGTADDTTHTPTTTWNDTTLTLSGLPTGLYRVTIDDALADETGRLFDGDGNGTAGGDFVRELFIHPFTGGLDNAFASDGTAETGGYNSYATFSSAIQADGKIVMVTSDRISSVDRAVVRRVNQDGTIDTSFGTGGNVVVMFPGSYAEGQAVTIQADGKIIVAGRSYTDSKFQHAFARLLSNGTLDTTFGTSGYTIVNVTNDGSANGSLSNILVLPDGKIISSGSTWSNGDKSVTLRLLANGQLDTSFGVSGIVYSAIAMNGGILARQSDGKFIVVGDYGNPILTRYLANGTVDTTFGTNGVVSLPQAIFGFYSTVNTIQIQADGTLIIAGTLNDGIQKIYIARLFADGSIDSSFGENGLAAIVSDSQSSRFSLAIQQDGKFILAGNITGSIGGDTLNLLRFNANGTADLTWGVNGRIAYPYSYISRYGNAILTGGRFISSGAQITRALLAPTNTLTGANGFTVNVDPDGAAAGQFFTPGVDAANALRVNGSDFNAALPTNSDADGGRTVVSNTQTLSGLSVQRESMVPTGVNSNFVRSIDTFTNPSGDPISATVGYVTNLASNAATTVFATSDGDTVVEPTDWWIATDDGNGTVSPAIVHVLGGPRGLKPASVELLGDSLVWSYNLNVADGETARLASFVIPGRTRSQALMALNSIIASTGFVGSGGAYFTQPVLDSLKNFTFLKRPTTVGTLANINGTEDIAIPVIPLRPAFADAEDGASGLTYSVVAVNGVYDLVHGSVNPDTDVLTLTPNLNANGTATVTVRATDSDGLWVDQTFNVTLDPIADAPLIDQSQMLMLTSVPKNSATPPGVTVASLLRNATNPDGSSAAYGIAVTGLGGVAGRWEYTLAVGGLWMGISSVNDGNALLLPRTALVRFIPDRNVVGHAGIQFRVWDGVSGLSGSFVNVSASQTSFSQTEVGWSPVGMTTPKFDDQGRAQTPAILEDRAGGATYAKNLLGLLTGEFTLGTKLGLAVIGSTGEGTWQVLVGRVWEPIVNVSDTTARLLKPTDLIRFVPSSNWTGQATLNYRAWKLPLVTPYLTVGDVTAEPQNFSFEKLTAVATVSPVNDAPVIDTSFSQILQTEPRKVSTLLNEVSDIDGTLTGIAITRVSAVNGHWEYRSSDLNPWVKIGSTSSLSALLLGLSSEIRFISKAGASSGKGAFDYKAVDNSILFLTGQRKAATSMAFSVKVETATTAFGNQSPTFKAGVTPVLSTAVRAKSGQVVSMLLTRMVDTTGFLRGLAITNVSGNGSWDYSIDGGRTWKSITVLSGQRILLRSTDRVRFTLNIGTTGTASLTFAAWDQTLGVAGDRVNSADDSHGVQLLTANLTTL